MNIPKLRKGFTLIEIVIVLAIAALIMVVVFLAVAGAQRSQRDQARKDLVNRAKAAMEQYKGNNNGQYPPAANLVGANNFDRTYMNADASDQLANQSGMTITFTADTLANTPKNGTCAAAGTDDGQNGRVVFQSDFATPLTGGHISGCLESGGWYQVTYP